MSSESYNLGKARKYLLPFNKKKKIHNLHITFATLCLMQENAIYQHLFSLSISSIISVVGAMKLPSLG